MKPVQHYKYVALTCFLLLIAQIIFSGCSTQQKVPAQKNTELQVLDDKIVNTKPLINNVEIPADFFKDIYPGYLRGITIVIDLPKGTEISATQLAELHELVHQSKASGTIYEVSLLAWGSDKTNLRTSADSNIKKIKATLMPLVQHPAVTPTVVLTAYNMEVIPAWSSRLLQTKDARIKFHFSKVNSTKMLSRIIVAISTTEQKNFIHPEMTVL